MDVNRLKFLGIDGNLYNVIKYIITGTFLNFSVDASCLVLTIKDVLSGILHWSVFGPLLFCYFHQ